MTMSPRTAGTDSCAHVQLICWVPRGGLRDRSGGTRFHSRTCTSAAWCGTGADGASVLATGGEDNKFELLSVSPEPAGRCCISPIRFYDGHLSSVRAVAVSSLRSGGGPQLLVTAGGLNTSLCWALAPDGAARWVGACRMPDGDVEQRVTSVVVMAPSTDGADGAGATVHALLSATSGGAACIHLVDGARGSVVAALTWQASSCAVMTVSEVRCGGAGYIATGDTSGTVTVFHHAYAHLVAACNGPGAPPLIAASERVHSTGVNAVRCTRMRDPATGADALVVLSVGDDQAIGMMLLPLSIDMRVPIVWRWDGVSSSLLRGASLCRGLLFTCGADQRLEVWRPCLSMASTDRASRDAPDAPCDVPTAPRTAPGSAHRAVLQRLGSALVDVGDVHCVAARESTWCVPRSCLLA